MTTQHPADREPQTEAGREMLAELIRGGYYIEGAEGTDILAIEAEAAARSASDTPRDREALVRKLQAPPYNWNERIVHDLREVLAADLASSTDEGLREALAAWFVDDPWERLAPGEGLVTTDEAFGCIACGATTPHIEADTSQPNWWDQPDHDANAPHEPLCLWVAARAALRVTGERSDSGLDRLPTFEVGQVVGELQPGRRRHDWCSVHGDIGPMESIDAHARRAHGSSAEDIRLAQAVLDRAASTDSQDGGKG